MLAQLRFHGLRATRADLQVREAYGAQEGLVYENEGEASLRIDA